MCFLVVYFISMFIALCGCPWSGIIAGLAVPLMVIHAHGCALMPMTVIILVVAPPGIFIVVIEST